MLSEQEITDELRSADSVGLTNTPYARALRQLQKAMRVVEAANLFCDDDTDTRLRALRDALAAMEED